jgi:outer membrane protein
MKKIILGLTVLIALASCQEQQKIGFINNGDVINEYQMKIDIEKNYENKNKKFNQKRDSIGRVYQSEIQSAQIRLANMSPQKQQEESQVFQQKWKPLEQQIQYEQQQMEQMFTEEMESVITAVNEFVESYGEKNGYTFILGKNQAGSVMYGKEMNDISDEVTKAINEAYKNKDSKTEEAKTEDKEASEE